MSDAMRRARLANGGRGAVNEKPGPFAQVVRDQGALDAIRMAGEVKMDAAQAYVFLNELRALGWDVTRQCGGQAKEATSEKPQYRKQRVENGYATKLFMVVVDEGWRTWTLCTDMYEWAADRLIEFLEKSGATWPRSAWSTVGRGIWTVTRPRRGCAIRSGSLRSTSWR